MRAQNIVWGAMLVLAMSACSSKHTVGAGDPDLGPVTITGPSMGGPVSGALTVAEAHLLIGAPFVGPTVPDAVPPGTPGVLTVTFTSDSTSTVAANLKFRAGVYDFDFTTANITGSLANAVIHYDGGHAGDRGSCVVWTSSNVVFTQGTTVDKLDGNWMGDCHHSDLARQGDRGVFHLTRPGTLVPPPPTCPEGQTRNNDGVCVPPPPPPAVDVCPNIDGVQTTIPVGYQKDEKGNCVVIPPPPPPVCVFTVSPLAITADGNDSDPHLSVTVTIAPQGCAPSTFTAVSNDSWIKQVVITGNVVTFHVIGQGAGDPERVGTLTIAGKTVTVTQTAKTKND